MKLHLPKTLLAAVMACTATFSGLSTTIGTGLITGGAMTIAFVAQEVGASVNTTYEYPGAETLTGGATVTPTKNTHYTVTDRLNHYTISQNGDKKYHVKISGQEGNETHLDSVATESLLIQSGRWRIENAGALTNAGHIYMGGGQIQFGVNQELSNDFTIGETTMSADGSTLSHSAFRVGDNEGQISVTLTGNLTVQENARISYQNSGKLYITGALSGSGNIQLDRYDGTGVLSISGEDKTYTGTITGHANVNMVLAANMSGATLDTKGSLSLGAEAVTIKALKGNGTLMLSGVANATLHIANAEGVFSGVISENVTLQVVGGTQTLNGATLGSTVQVGTGATLTLSGSITLADSLVVRNASESEENGFGSVSATVACGAGTIDATDVTWYAQGGKKQGTLTNGVLTFTSSVYDIKKAGSEVSSTDAATAGATGYYITGSGSTLTLKNVGAPADLPAGVVINVGDTGTATVVISEGCDWTAAEADTILDKQSGNYELTVKDGAKLSFTEYKDLGTNVINVADGGILELKSCASGWAWFRETINVNGEGKLVLSAGDSLGWSGADPTKAINIKGTAAEGETLAKIAVVQVTGKQTLSTNINLSGNTHIQNISEGQFEFFGGIISASGTNNIIDVDIKTCRTGEFAVDENASLTLNGDIIQGQNNQSTYVINKTGKGELQLKGSTIYGTFNLVEGSLALLNDMTIEQGGSLVASSGTSLQLGASIINKGTVNIFDSALSIDSYGHFKQYGEGEGTITFSRDGTDGFEIITGLEYYLIEGSGGKITGTKPTQIGNYTITYYDNGDAIISGGSFVSGIYQVKNKDITLTADEISHATGYVVKEGLVATVANATSDGISSVTMEDGSTLKLSSDTAVEYTGGSFNVSGVAKLELTGAGIVWNKQITCANAYSALQLTVTDGSNVLWTIQAPQNSTHSVTDVTIGKNATMTVAIDGIKAQYPVFVGNINTDSTITLQEGATLNSGNLFGWYTDGDPRACARVVNLEKNSTWNILSGGGPFYINRTTINLSGAKIVLGDGVSMNFERPNNNDVNVISTTATAEQMSLITAAAGSATAGTLKFQNTGGVFDIKRGSFTLDETNTADLKVDVAIDKGNSPQKLTKKGDGVLELTKNNTYEGGTEVQAGTLVAAAETALGTGKVLVNGGTLKGTVGLNISELEHTSGTILLTEGETSITKGLSTTAIDLTGTSKLVLGIADNDDANKKFSIGKTVGKANLQLNEGSVELGGSTHDLNELDISNRGTSNAQVTLKSGAVVSTNGKMWLGTDAGITLENTASLMLGSVTISGDKESVDGSIARDGGGDQYASNHTNYTISNSKITIAQNSEKGNGWIDLKNKLRNTSVVNEGNDLVLVYLNDQNFDISGIEANKGNVNLAQMAKDAELASLKIAAGLKVGAHSGHTGIGAGTDFKTLSVVDVVAMGAGSVVDGHLSLGEKATLELSGITAESSTAIIEGNLALTKGNLTLSGDVLKALAEIEAGQSLTIMTIGESLIVDGETITESITMGSEGYSLAEVFTNTGFEDYYLGFNYVPADEAGYSTVYIGMIVPEPTTATLSLLALAALAARRRRK